MVSESLADTRHHHEERLHDNQPAWTRGTRGTQQEAMAQQELEAPVDRRDQHDERQHNNQPDKRHKRGLMRGGGAMRQRRRQMGDTGMMRGDTTNSRGGQEASAPEKKRSTKRGGGTMRGGQVEALLDGRWWHVNKLRPGRARGNTTTSQGRQEA